MAECQDQGNAGGQGHLCKPDRPRPQGYSRIAEAGENQTHYQAERQTIEKGFFARLLRKTRTSQEFEQQTGSSFEKTVEELDRAKTYFQKNVGREVLDQVQDVDSTTQELTDEVARSVRMMEISEFGKGNHGLEMGVVIINLTFGIE